METHPKPPHLLSPNLHCAYTLISNYIERFYVSNVCLDIHVFKDGSSMDVDTMGAIVIHLGT